MYPSDYAYMYAYGVDNTCYTDIYYCYNGNRSAGWLSYDYEWLITPKSNWDGGAFGIYGGGYGGMRYNVYGDYGVRPVVHLRSDIVLTGSGTSTDPYKIVSE